MARTHNLGFPRVGAQRELKFAEEKHWKGLLSHAELEQLAAGLRQQTWQRQAGLDLVPVGDFSFYDQVLDTSFLLGNVPERARAVNSQPLDAYFRVARGRAAGDVGAGVAAGEMTKWFDTNYHYIVPELSAETSFQLDASRLLSQLAEARKAGVRFKPVIIGPVTYLWVGKTKDSSNRLALLPKLLPVYRELLTVLAREGADWVQIDEPALVTELASDWQQGYRTAYDALEGAGGKLLLTTYFGRLGENLELAAKLPVDGIHLDAVSARTEVDRLLRALPERRVLSLGVVSGRNIWKADLAKSLDFLEPVHDQLRDRLWLASSCSLLHVPVDLASEKKLDPELLSWLSFAQQKLDEVRVLGVALNQGRDAVKDALSENTRSLNGRRNSSRVNNPRVKAAIAKLEESKGERQSPYGVRAALQARAFNLPQFPTTTIGSFPQTVEIRKARSDFRAGKLEFSGYQAQMRKEIERAVREQEQLGLDVLVHGEAERNDMVEYFGEQLDGYAFSEFGWEIG